MKTKAAMLTILLAWLSGTLASFAYYNPATGRWLSRDPIGGPGLRMGSSRPRIRSNEDSNPFAFVENRPVTTTDKLGLAGNPPCGVNGPCPVQNPSEYWYQTIWCFCRCQSVSVFFEPGFDKLDFNWYKRGTWDVWGSQIHILWKTTGNPQNCKYFHDELNTETAAFKFLPEYADAGHGAGVVTPVPFAYTDYLGFYINQRDKGTWHYDVYYDVVLRCVGNDGQTVVRRLGPWAYEFPDLQH